MIFRFLPREFNFFDLFEKQAQYAVDAADCFKELVSKNILDEISKSSREVRVRVYWGEFEDEQEDYVLTTHIVKL